MYVFDFVCKTLSYIYVRTHSTDMSVYVYKRSMSRHFLLFAQRLLFIFRLIEDTQIMAINISAQSLIDYQQISVTCAHWSHTYIRTHTHTRPL